MSKPQDIIDKILEKGKDKLKGPEGKEAIKFLKDHRKDLEGIGKDLLERMVAHVGMGEPEKAKDLYLIKYQTAQELIDGLSKSGDVFLEAHRKMAEKAEKVNAMWKKIGEGAAQKLLPILVSLF